MIFKWPKNLNTHPPEKITQLANKHMKKMFYIICHQGNAGSDNYDSVTHLIEWSKSRTLTIPNTREDPEPQEPSLIPDRNSVTLENSLMAFYKIKHTPTT